MNLVSTPVLTYRNGSGSTGGFRPAGSPVSILVRLQLDAGQGVSDRLRFQNAGRLPVDEQHVIGEPVAGRHPELAHRDPEPGREIHLVAVLDDPARLGERRVDLLAGLLLRRQRHAHLSGRQLPFSS